MKIVFMGTPDFAVPSLEMLHNSNHDVLAVVTTPDKPKGRGLKLQPSPIKQKADSLGLNVLQPDKMSDIDFQNQLKELKADCFVVVAFRILPESVFSIPEKGTINLHTSLLPKYRGAAPIQWAIMNGETETGLTTFVIEKKVDTGAILLQKTLSIGDDEDAGSLHDRMAEAGSLLLLETVEGIESQTIKSAVQEGHSSPAPKILPEHCQIDWSRKAVEIKNQVRGLSPRPTAFTYYNGKRIKVFRVSVLQKKVNPEYSPGTIWLNDASEMCVATGENFIRLHDLQIEGKKRMPAEDFLRGSDIQTGQRLD